MPRIAHWGEEDFDHSLDCPQILLQSSRIKICQNLPIIEKISFRSCKVYTCHITFTTAAAQENYFVKQKHSKKNNKTQRLESSKERAGMSMSMMAKVKMTDMHIQLWPLKLALKYFVVFGPPESSQSPSSCSIFFPMLSGFYRVVKHICRLI